MPVDGVPRLRRAVRVTLRPSGGPAYAGSRAPIRFVLLRELQPPGFKESVRESTVEARKPGLFLGPALEIETVHPCPAIIKGHADIPAVQFTQ